ncbi:hypothetical protein ABB37_08834 [Leptomonas pyrrhocoris]|uniref:Uncharacterized protein n=1 Tax=Leptomonas pyrrhocoris TaxID=157538 RepID=A0A0N0DRZ7_LEPPY|nr:hypothetical protein ABB37_08834 [Leptomonas pyrrhocoris]KPA75172.1 hypothetical protein ABB37_08834 [Leptomonas pyrrhocoris]|eukprot:XP_015653611.1 hypothetical protein ABB37_08834 [Leptomonas pyrrhocoris]
MSAAAAAAENGQYDDTSQGNGTNVHNGADSLALPASVRAYLGMEECINAETRSAATTTTTAIRRRDVDDEARDRLTAMQQQRAAQQQQQVVDAAQQQRQLQEEKLRTAALQARVKTMKSELDTLRTYVGTMLDKSATDDELVEAYKLEVRHAQEEMREWVKNAAMQGIPNTEMESLKLTGVRDGVGAFSAAATAGTRSVPYRKVALPPPSAVAPPVSVASDARDKQPPASPHPPQQQQQQQQQQSSSSTMQQDVDAVVYEWVRRACQEGTARKDRRAAGAASAADRPSPPPASAVAAVLRSALEHVAQVERHATAVSALGGADATSREGKACPEEEAAATQVEKVLLMENASLKKRMRALTDMVEREMAAQKVLWNSRDAKGEGKHDP